MSSGSTPSDRQLWPVEIRLKRSERVLEVDFNDGRSFSYSAELLRVESPSADVQGHGPSQKTTPGGKRMVAITAVEPVGNYAVRITFDDGHATGIYSWRYLYEKLGVEQDSLWRDYLERIEQQGLIR